MRTVEHHVQRLAQRWLEAETLEDPAQAGHVIRKAAKHQKAIDKLQRQLRKARLWPWRWP